METTISALMTFSVLGLVAAPAGALTPNLHEHQAASSVE
jgi:hypothetical protein